MNTALNLNENETKVLKALAAQMQDCTGGEFGYINDTDRCGLSKHEFAGYIGSLTKKDVFEYIEPLEHLKSAVQFILKEEIYEQYL
jgi:hypothetical protein